MTAFVGAITTYVMVRSVPEKPERVSNHERRRCNAILAQSQKLRTPGARNDTVTECLCEKWSDEAIPPTDGGQHQSGSNGRRPNFGRISISLRVLDHDRCELFHMR